MKKKLLSLILVGVLGVCTACSTAWLTTFENYLKVVGPILVQILDIVSLVEGKPVNTQLQAKITGDAAAINAIAASINAATVQNVVGECAQFNLAVATLQSDLSQVEQLANVGPNASAEIAAAVGIAQAAFTEVEAPISACSASSSNAQALAALKAGSVGVSSPEDVVKKFNAVVDKKHHVHLHSLFVRILTFGIAQ
jgi:hypothetical protein